MDKLLCEGKGQRDNDASTFQMLLSSLQTSREDKRSTSLQDEQLLLSLLTSNQKK